MEVEPSFWQNPDGLKSIYKSSGCKRNASPARRPSPPTPRPPPPRSPSIIRACSPPSPSRSTGPRAFRWATSSPRPSRSRTRWACPRDDPRQFPGHGPGLTMAAQAGQPMLILAAIFTVLHRAGRTRRKLCPPDHHPSWNDTLQVEFPADPLRRLLFKLDLTVIAVLDRHCILLIGIVKKNAIMMIDFGALVRRAAQRGKEAQRWRFPRRACCGSGRS